MSYGGEVGIGITLTEALGDALGASPIEEPSGNEGGPGGDGGEGDGGKGNGGEEIPVPDQIRDLLIEAEEAFADADEAQRNGDTVRWAELMEEGKELRQRGRPALRHAPRPAGRLRGAGPRTPPRMPPGSAPDAAE